MSDDGLLLNLAESEPSSSKKGNGKKGGRWTDRVKAKRVGKRKDEEPPAVEPSEQRPTKRRRTSPQPSQTKSFQQNAPPAAKQGQIISSLFTSNPAIVPPTQGPMARKNQPSNAPLTDASTFAGLGLDPLLVSHITQKMSIATPTGIQRSSLSLLLPESPLNEGGPNDAFVQSQTGSGKTLSYLLPIVQNLLPLCRESWIDRTIGTLAVIIAPTRELASQIHNVLESLLRMNLGEGMTRFLVAGLLIGGSTRQHEKARLRKGVGVLVATPGRLLDHLQHTSSFEIGKCSWLVLDEADHLMSLGFEQTIKDIIDNLESRRKLSIQASNEGILGSIGWDWENRSRRTILCSATMRDDVKKLAGSTLRNPFMIKELFDPMAPKTSLPSTMDGDNSMPLLQAPSQLTQKYVIVPLKLRLVSLVALMRSLLANTKTKRGGGAKIIVFFSCTDSVDWHMDAFGTWGADSPKTEGMEGLDGEDSPEDNKDDDPEGKTKKRKPGNGTSSKSPLLPNTTIHKLHGNLSTALRLASLSAFSASSSNGENKILFTTSLSSRGLSIPSVGAIVQYDLPTEGGMNEYIHRVGRTARLGAEGESWCFLSPSEDGWVAWAKQQVGAGGLKLNQGTVEGLLRTGFTPTLKGKGKDYEQRATEVQLGFERAVLKDSKAAQTAFSSHVKAYTTHPSAEKHIFHVRQVVIEQFLSRSLMSWCLRNLHLGHLAKSFGLREAPSSLLSSNAKASKRMAKQPGKKWNKPSPGDSSDSSEDEGGSKGKRKERDGVAEKRMTAMVRAQGRLSKKGGKMERSGAVDEFQIGSGGYALG